MDLTLTEEQRLIQSTARELLDARRAGAGVRAVAGEPAGHSGALWKEMVELGWTGMAIPERYGGLAAGFLEACLLIEELGRAAVPAPYLTTVACCGMPIARYAAPDQRGAWLGAIARGRVMTAVARDRWDPTGPVLTETAQGFVLDGTADYVPYARAADDLLIVGERPDGRRTALLVDAATPGIERRALEAVGIHPLDRLIFEGVTVAADRALPADGGAVADAITAYGAAATCAEMIGGAERVLDMTVEYATAREQFGRPIGTFQAVQHHCADMAVDVLGSRLVAYEAIWRLAADRSAGDEVSIAKAWVSEAYQRLCATGHQVHGAIGFTAEHDLHLYLRHATAAALAFGDGDFHTEQVARGLGLPPG